MVRVGLRSGFCLFAVVLFCSTVAGCGVVGTAADVTYRATKTTVKAAGGAVKWAYRGSRRAYQKVTASDEAPEDYDADTQDDAYYSDHTASTKPIRLPEVVERP